MDLKRHISSLIFVLLRWPCNSMKVNKTGLKVQSSKDAAIQISLTLVTLVVENELIFIVTEPSKNTAII